MKSILLALSLFFCVPAWSADAPAETPEQKQALIAKSTATIVDLKVKVREAGQQNSPLPKQEASFDLMVEYVVRAQLLEDLKEWKRAAADYGEADEARRVLYYERFNDAINREAIFKTKQAYCYLRSGDYEDAGRSINNARDAKGWANRIYSDSLVAAMICLVYNRPDQALKDALDAKSRSKGFERDALVAQSLALFQKGEYEQAQATWAEVLKAEPAYKPVLLFEPELAKLNAAIAQNPKDARAWFLRGTYYKNAGDRYGRLGIKDADYTGSWVCLPTDFRNFASHEVFFWDAAQRDLSESFRLDRNPQALARRAQCLYTMSKVKAEDKKGVFPPNSTWRSDVQLLLKIGTDDFNAMHALAILQTEISKDSTANSVRRQNALIDANFANSLAILHHPEEGLAASYRRTIDEEGDKLIESTQTVTAPTATNAKTALEWKEAGNKASDANNLFLARQYYQKALEVDPKFADAQNNLGSLYSKVGNYPRALEAYRAAIQLDPQHRVAHSNVATSLVRVRFYKESVEPANKAVQFAATPGAKLDALDTRATIFIKLEDYASAKTDLRTQTVLDPTLARPWQRLGMIALAAAEMDGAREALQKCANIDAKDGFVRVLLAMAVNGCELQKLAKERGVEMKSLDYSEREAISLAAQELLKDLALSRAEKNLLLDFWNETILPGELGKDAQRPLTTGCLQILNVALGAKQLTFTGDAAN